MLHEGKFAHAMVAGTFYAGTETRFNIGPYGKNPRVSRKTTAREVREFIGNHMHDFLYEVWADSEGKLHVNAFDKTAELVWEMRGETA